MPSLSFLPKELYTPKGFIAHAASLHQGFPHCARFPTAASRRSLARVSVPVWPCALSGRLSIFGLVGFYPANYLIDRGLLSRRLAPFFSRTYAVLAQVFQVIPHQEVDIHVLLTSTPLYSGLLPFSFDLHVLSAPPALILSRDQTLV